MAEHVDGDILDSLREIMEDDFGLLIQTFINDSKERLQQLRQASEVTCADSIRRVAHSLKGSASNVGAQALADLCFQVEQAGIEGNINGLDSQIDAIEAELVQVNTLLATYL